MKQPESFCLPDPQLFRHPLTVFIGCGVILQIKKGIIR